MSLLDIFFPLTYQEKLKLKEPRLTFAEHMILSVCISWGSHIPEKTNDGFQCKHCKYPLLENRVYSITNTDEEEYAKMRSYAIGQVNWSN